MPVVPRLERHALTVHGVQKVLGRPVGATFVLGCIELVDLGLYEGVFLRQSDTGKAFLHGVLQAGHGFQPRVLELEEFGYDFFDAAAERGH